MKNFIEKGKKIDPILKIVVVVFPFFHDENMLCLFCFLKDADPTLSPFFSFIFPSVFINISTLFTTKNVKKNKRKKTKDTHKRRRNRERILFSI